MAWRGRLLAGVLTLGGLATLVLAYAWEAELAPIEASRGNNLIQQQ